MLHAAPLRLLGRLDVECSNPKTFQRKQVKALSGLPFPQHRLLFRNGSQSLKTRALQIPLSEALPLRHDGADVAQDSAEQRSQKVPHLRTAACADRPGHLGCWGHAALPVTAADSLCSWHPVRYDWLSFTFNRGLLVLCQRRCWSCRPVSVD